MRWGFQPDYATDGIMTNERRYVSRSPIFEEQDREHGVYDAYEKDIAVAHFYFTNPTVFQFTRDVSKVLLVPYDEKSIVLKKAIEIVMFDIWFGSCISRGFKWKWSKRTTDIFCLRFALSATFWVLKPLMIKSDKNDKVSFCPNT